MATATKLAAIYPVTLTTADIIAAGGLTSVPNLGGAFIHPGYAPQFWYSIWPPVTMIASNIAAVVGTSYCVPFQVPIACHIKALGTRITTAGTTSIALALYNNNSGANATVNRPGTLIDNTAAIANTSANTTVNGPLGASRALQPGWYWAALQSGDATVRYSAINSNQNAISSIIGCSNASNINTNSGTVTGVSFPGTYGTWIADASTQTFTEIITTNQIGPAIVFQVDTVP
jgi:hypothetical protein